MINKPIFKQSTQELRGQRVAAKLKRYYTGDFITDYNGPPILTPGKTIEQVLKTDNVIARTVNRYASSVLGKYCSVEFEAEELQEVMVAWGKKTKLQSKMTTIARYQSLYGGAVVKVLFKFPQERKNEDGTFNLDGLGIADLPKYIDIAVFGMDKAQVTYDDYNNLESISIIIGTTAEVFYSDRIEVFTAKQLGVNDWTYSHTEPNPFGVPLAYFIPNIELGTDYLSDVADIVPLQEALNNAITQHNNNVTFHGMPQWYAKGLAAPMDENGNPVPFKFGAGMVLHSTDKDAEFGKIQVEGLEATAIEAYTKQVSLATYSLSLMTGNIPSGEALIHLSKDFNALITEKQGKVTEFMEAFYTNFLVILDYLFDTTYTGTPFKVFIAGYNPLAERRDFEEAFQLHSVGAISLKTLLDTTDIVDNTQDELDRMAEESSGSVEPPIVGDE